MWQLVIVRPPRLHPGTLPLPQSWQPVKEEMNNKVNKVKVANCVNEGYEFPVEEVDYENTVWNEDKEVITKNKDSPNEQLAGQAEALNGQIQRNIKDTANYYYFSLQIMCVNCGIVHIILCKDLKNIVVAGTESL